MVRLDCRSWAASAGVFHGEADFDGDLIVLHLAVLDMAARFENFEPSQMPNGFVGTRNRRADCVFNAFFRRADKFDDFVDMLFHDDCSLASRNFAAISASDKSSTPQMFRARP